MKKLLCSTLLIFSMIINLEGIYSIDENRSEKNLNTNLDSGLTKTQKNKLNRLINSYREPSFEYFVEYLKKVKETTVPVGIAAARYVTTWLKRDPAKTHSFYNELKDLNKQKELFERTGVKISIENNKMHFEYMKATVSSRFDKKSLENTLETSTSSYISNNDICAKSNDIISELSKLKDEISGLKKEVHELKLVVTGKSKISTLDVKDLRSINTKRAVNLGSEDEWNDQKIKDVLIKKYPITFGELDKELNSEQIFNESISNLNSSLKYSYLREKCNDVLTGKDKPIYNLQLPDDSILEPYLKKYYGKFFAGNAFESYLKNRKQLDDGHVNKKYELRSILGHMESAKNEQYRRYIDLKKNQKSIKDRVDKFNDSRA